MKRFLIFLSAAAFSLPGCDDSVDLFAERNSPPSISIYKGVALLDPLTDTVKFGYPKAFTFRITDEENLSLTHEVNAALSVSINNENRSLSVDANASGLQQLNLYTVDSFNRSTSVPLSLFCFENWLPVAKLNLSVIDGYVVKIDASASSDPDLRFGGGIIGFEYTINGITYPSTKNTIIWGYGSGGTKTVKVRVQDNNQAWSSWVTEYINL